MIKSLCLVVLLLAVVNSQIITPYTLLPVQTTRNTSTTYSFLFYTDTAINSYSSVAITFPFQFSVNALTQATRVRYAIGKGALTTTTWTFSLRTFMIPISPAIPIGNLTIVIDNILNPADYSTSSYFVVSTLFKSVVVTSNNEYGRVPFTETPITTPGGLVNNRANNYIQQGATWALRFTPSTTYPPESSLRFIFPEGFKSNRVECNVSGIVDPSMVTRVLPGQHIFDCMNLKSALTGSTLVLLSGLVNPDYQMTVSGVQIHILEPNNKIVRQIITSASSNLVKQKPLKTSVTIPNQYRNNSATYIFQMNLDTNLLPGDYMTFQFTGLWTLFANATRIISGVRSSNIYQPLWETTVNTTSSLTTLKLSNFSMVPKSERLTFYQPLMTPLNAGSYPLTISAYRSHGGLAQRYSRSITINQTTGYIKEMKLHPMQSPIKLPVGKTGPIEIVLFLRNNLPKTNVLTYGKIVIDITPNIPEPIVSINGVPKCYFYYNTPATNCTFDSTTDPTKTVVTIFTPTDFNFQQSEVPLTITTEGFAQPENQGITIDTLVKRYFFEIQFYSHLSPPPVPLEVIFDQWIPDSIGITSVSCENMNRNNNQYDHIKCTFVTPNQVLNDGHTHYFRVVFSKSGYYSWDIGWVGATNQIYPDYPCLMYGANISADPYVKCDYVTWHSGPYKSSQSSTSYSYITFYGLDRIPGGSTIEFEIPKIQRSGSSRSTQLDFSILEDTPGYSSPIVYIYTQTVSSSSTSGGSSNYGYEVPSITLTNSVINKVTDITLNNYGLGTTDPRVVIFEVDQTAFPNIGRGQGISCGSHTCSKFDKPVQYFILYPSSNLGSSATLTFPSIATPPYSGDFTFYTRILRNAYTYKKGYFSITITPEPIVTSSYSYHTNETITTLYPNSDHFFTISWTTVNPLLTLGGNARANINIDNIFTLSSTHCEVTTSASAYDGRGIWCELTPGGTSVDIKNLADVPAGSTFSVILEMRSTSTASSVSPTVTIKTYYGNNAIVDQAVNVPFAISPMTNTNLTIFSSFTLPSSTTSTKGITAGYFGHLLVSFDPVDSATVINGSKIILTLPSEFTPATNSLGLPLSCNINAKRFPCTYTINPFVITLTKTNSSFTTSSNIINITTEYQNVNGINYPATQGRYYLELQILNETTSESLQKVQQTIDILPPDVGYFNVSWAVRDIDVYNIWTIQFKNGQTPIPSYNDGANAGRITFGFPTIDENSGAVFATDLGFTNIKEGAILPCYFQTASGFVGPSSGKTLQCKIRQSFTNNYNTWVEVVNFAAIPAGGKMRLFLAKVKNPSVKQIDIDFVLKINKIDVSTNIESQLYLTTYNMFIDMVTKSITNRNQVDSTTVLFQPGASVGMTNQYISMIPYSGGTFVENDWWIVDLDTQFPLSGNIYNCQKPYYQYCMIFPTVNWLAVKIGNGTLLTLQPFISQLPLSISRVDTYFKAYTFMSGRWSQTITYTVTANYRWLQIRGTISAFSIEVVGNQNNLNVGQKNVEVLVKFTTEHLVPKGGSIQIQFPNNSTTVPAIKQHCRSAVSMGSVLYGYDTGKPAVNVQGQIGCSVQNSYSWIITGFAQLPAGSQVIIYGMIDFPTTTVSTLGMGYVCTYSNQDSSNTFTTAKTIDYLRTNFPMAVQNLTWNVDTSLAKISTAPLRVNYVGELKFFINLDSTFTCSSFGNGNCGNIYVNLDRLSITGSSGGFGAPPSNLVCTIFNPATGLKYGCGVNYYYGNSQYYGYQILTYQSLPSNTVLQMTITTQHGSGTEGIPFPTSVGTYKTEVEIRYCGSCNNDKSQAQYIEVYGPDWTTLEFYSTVTIPAENNFIMVVVKSPSSITASQQIVIQIPTVALDGTALFPADLGMGYQAYDKLVFDLFQSSISSMDCRVYPGSVNDQQPTKIVCSGFSSTITSSMTVKFGFWVVNPAISVGMAIPVQIYAYDQPTARKYVWSMQEAGIRLIPITVTPISDLGNFATSSSYREISGLDFDFTTRNTKAMVQNDWYILKFNFDLRQSANSNGNFHYNSGFSNSGDVIFMENCKTVLLRVGSTNLALMASGSTTINARINNLFYNPSTQLTTAQATIRAYAIYKSIDDCQRVYYSDLFPTLVPNQPSSPTFTITDIYATRQKQNLDDWYFNFRMSSSAGNSTSLVKYISIQMPSRSTSDFVLTGRQCVQRTDSQFELEGCVIDITNRMIWITPVIKTTYNDANYLRIQTADLAIKAPTTTAVNRNQFIIRYYTWPDGMAKPTITRGSDNWCFMRQDSTRISSSSISMTTYYSSMPLHRYMSVPETFYVNQFEPAHYYIGNSSVSDNMKKSPFIFKLIAPSTFNSYEGTSNYHEISVDFSGVYSTPTLNQNSNDLYYYVPYCELNGFSIKQCSITSGIIKMRFQQAIANGDTIGVTFNIINPKDESDQGFILANTNNPTVTLPVYIYNRNTGITYLTNPEHFHTYYRATSNTAAYPSYGIQDVSVVYGTQIQGQLNYLEFTVTLTRTDINGFVIEIPVLHPDGTKIYNDPTLMGLESGQQYPCSLGVYVPVYCYYQKGSTNGFGSPTRIYVTGFGTPSTTFNFRILFTNPDNSDVFPTFIWKAFGGSYTSPDLMGQQFKGIHQLIDAFKVYTTVNYYSTGSLTCYPNKALWTTDTYYDCYTSQEHMAANTYAIMKWPLVDPTYGTIGDYVYDATYIYDQFFMFQANNQHYVYLVQKLTSGFTAGTSSSSTYTKYGGITSYYRWGKLRMKHHLVNSYKMYLLRKPATKIYTCSVSHSFMGSYLQNNYYGTMSLYNMDTQVRINGYNGWQFVSVNAGNIMSSYAGNVYDPSEKVIEVQLAYNRPYSTLSSTTTDCVLQSGLISNDPLKPITCYVDRANNRLLFRNVYWFTNTRLNFYYYATTASDFSSFDIITYVWANEDAYSERNWIMYRSTTNSNWGYDYIDYASNTGYSSLGGSQRPFGNNVMDLSTGSNGVGRTRILNNNNIRTEGYSTITYVSSTQIKVKLYSSVSRSLHKAFRMGFRFYTPRLTTTSCQSVSVWTSRWGWNNFNGNSYSPGSFGVYCGNGGSNTRRFYAIFDMYYTSSSSRYPYQWPNLSNGDTYEFTFTFSSVSGDATNYPNYLWVSASMLWEDSYYYYRSSTCGCCYQPCCSVDIFGICLYTCCQTYCNCRRIQGWDYYTFTGTQGVGYSQSTNNFAGSTSISLLSEHYSDETELGIYVGNTAKAITTTMTSFTNQAHAELVIQLKGNTNYPNNNPFPYTSNSEEAAYIDCLCVRGNSAVSITASTSWTAGNCTRHINNGRPFISLRYNAPAGSYLYCYFPGFKVPSSGGGSSFYVNFIWNYMHFFNNLHSIPYYHYSPYRTQSSSLTLSSTGTSNVLRTFNQNGYFWPSSGQVLQQKRWYLYLRLYATYSNPYIYYSAYYPKVTQSACSSTSQYYVCRAYNLFHQRRYFLVAQRKGSQSITTFDYTATFPQSKDMASSPYYSGYIGWTRGGASTYYSEYTWSYSSSMLTQATPTYGVTVPIYGSTLKSYSSPFVVAVDLNGHTLYSNQRTVGPNTGSFIEVTASSFTTLYGCGVYLEYENIRAYYNNALYCKVISSQVMKIQSNSDLTFTGKLIITFSTNSIPTSTTVTVKLFDKYISGSDYGKAVQVSQTITNNPSYSILPSTSIKWRRMAYKQLRTDAAPLRLIMNNNFQYVSVWSTSTNSVDNAASNGLITEMPMTGSASQKYKCLVRQYPPTKYYLYTEYTIDCSAWSTTQVLFKSIPSHILKPEYYYEFIAYENNGASNNLFTMSSAGNYKQRIWSGSNYNSWTTTYHDVVPVRNYLSTNAFTLNSIYILTREAAVTNSLYLHLTNNIATTSVSYLELQFDQLDLNYFGIVHGQKIPCYLNGLSASSGSSEGVVCFGYSTGSNNTSPLIVRVVNFASYSAGTSFNIALDNFNNPPLQKLFLVPINIKIKMQDRTNQKIYSSYFPNVYYSDSISLRNTAQSTGTLSPNSNYFGSSTYHSWTVNWPYTSSNSVDDKIVVNIDGGVTCCSPYSSLATLSDQWHTLTKLWMNTKANTTVYQMPSRSSGTSTTFRVNNVINPNPVAYDTYQKGKMATFKWYSNYQTYNIYRVSQPNYSSYNKNSDFVVSGASHVSGSKPNHMNSHQYYPLTYEINWDLNANSYNGRNISHIMLYFTSGVRWIQAAWFRYYSSVINNVGSAVVGYDSGISQWYIKITGVQDSHFSASNNWYLRVRLYANNNNRVYYTSYIYNYNGQLQFNTQSNNFRPSDVGFSTDSRYGRPNLWTYQHLRYTHGYYQLQRKHLYAQASQTTNKLFFKFTAPYAISQIETITLVSSSNTFPAPNTPANKLYCTIQPTDTQYVSYGAGLYASCAYSSGTFTVNAPVGGLAINTEYLLTVIERDQLSTTFNMPTTPTRIDISLIYKSFLNLAYGDVYTLDFSGMMTSYSVSHSHLMSGYYDMLGFTLRPSFALSAASTSAPVTESVLSFEVESKYYDHCLSIDGVFSPDNMPFYSGVYYSHYASIAVANANTRIKCGINAQAQNYAPAILSITDYGALSTGTSYYFRFPLIALPSGTNVPLTYKVKLLYYANGQPYPTVISEYSYENKQRATGATSNSNQWADLSLTTNSVQKTMSMSFSYRYSGGNFGNGAETVVKFRNNYIPALTSLATLATLSNSYFAYEYYPNINLALFRYTGSGTTRSFSLGTYPTSIDQQPFSIYFVQTFQGTTRKNGYFNSGTTIATYTVSAASAWSTSSFTKGSQLVSTNSYDKYTVSWKVNDLTFPEGSRMLVTFNNRITLLDEYCYSHSGFIAGVNADSNLVCKRYSSNQILISGYATLGVGATLTITVYAAIQNSLTAGSSYSASTTVTVISAENNNIISANTNTASLSLSAVKGCNALGLSGAMERPYSVGSAFPLFITFRLNTHSLVNGDYLQVDFGNWVLDPASVGVQVFKYQVSGSIYWVPSTATLVSGNIYKIPVYLNYSMTAGTTITLKVDTFAPDTYYGAQSSSIQWNTFKVYAYKSASLVEQQVYRVWTEPYGHASFAASSVLNYVGASTLYEFSVTPNVSAVVGDTIMIEFTTADGLENPLFSNNLGATIAAPNPGSFDCNQAYNTHIISDSIIQCRVYQGDNTATPSTPTTIAIPITKAIPANTAIKFNILGITNPAVSDYPIGVVLKLANTCSSSDQNNLCAYYKSVTYMTFNTAPAGVSTYTTGSLTFNPNIVSATNTEHILYAGYSLSSGDWLRIKYYSQVPIPSFCSITSSNGECYSYPTDNIIMIKATSAQSGSYTFKLGGMTNPYQRYYGSYTFYTQVWSASGSISRKFYTNYAAGTITTDPSTSNPLSITFTPTLTPDYQLKYGFNNIAKIEITHMLQNKNIQMIYIYAGSEISIDTQYCNATLTTLAGDAKPYPHRFICTSMNSRWVKLNMQSDFPTWTSAFTARSIFIYLRYTISNGQNNYGNYWNAYAYTHATSTSSNYLVSHATGRFAIVEYLLPYLYVISLYTKSFMQRTCAVEQQCMFYGFMLPSTLQSDITVRYMTFLLPQEFKYTPTRILDKCTLQPTTTSLWTFNCGVSRQKSQITINYTPNSGTYNQWYNLINLDHSDAASLFTAPAYPGNHYQMQVNLWTSGGNLVQSQYVNLTTVFGFYLSVPDINFLIPNDGDAKGLFDLTFLVGNSDILPAYDNSASNSITSAIEISFSNSFAADLGTGLTAGSEIACLNISGLTFNTMGRIKCQIYPSVSTITFPTIIVTGYDRISRNSIVRIQFANLQTLPTGVTDYCKLGVSLSYYHYGGVKGYIYEPVSFVLGPTTASNTPKAISFTVSETGSNIVGQLTDYAFSGSIASGFAPVTPSDYFVVEFPKYTFEGRFHLNAQALCSLAAASACSVFGLASQIYFQPASTVSSTSFSFTIQKLLNAAFKLSYVDRTVRIFTVVGKKVDAEGTGTFRKFTQASSNLTARIINIGSIYGGDSGIQYRIGFQLNSYLPENGKISLFFPNVYTSLFTTNSRCYLTAESMKYAGVDTYCKLINYWQLVVDPNGVLLDSKYQYKLVVTNVTNPNIDLSSYLFTIETYHFSSVYNPSIISQAKFSPKALSLRTVKDCQLQVSLSVYNPEMPAQYQFNLICPSSISSASHMKIYLDWEPSPSTGTCSSDANTLYSTQCDIINQYSGNKKLTFLSIYLRTISAQKLVTITSTITNGLQGTYKIKATIGSDSLVELQATSNSFYITSPTSSTASTQVISTSTGTVITSSGQAISIKSQNYPNNRRKEAIFTFAVTKPSFVVSTLQVDVPDIITSSAAGITCGHQSYVSTDNYFNLKAKLGTNSLTCSMKGQKLTFTGLSTLISGLTSSQFLYLTVEGLLNPDTSVSQTNFTFTFIDTSSTYNQAILRFDLPLSFTVSNPPTNMQIESITLSNPKYYARSTYTFTLSSISGSTFTIAKHSQLGVIVHFPVEYSEIWSQIATPSTLSLVINGNTYDASQLRMTSRYLFAPIPRSLFTTQIDFTTFNVVFDFRNPKKAIDCKVNPVFTISLFDFKGNSIYSQTLSNNQVCPTFTTKLFDIKVTGNTKIAAGASSTFYVTLEKRANNLTIAPSCQSSAISFIPSSIQFLDYKQKSQSFKVVAANGLSGSFKVTFAKQEATSYTFYSDIQFLTLDVYIPTNNYYIKIDPFKRKSVGRPITVTIQLEVPSTKEFVLVTTNNCSSFYVFEPAQRIIIPADTSNVSFTVAYTGTTIPEACWQQFSISSLSTNNYVLQTPKIYYSATLSIDRADVQRPMVLRVTTKAQRSANVGHTIISSSSSQTTKYVPEVYTIVKDSSGSNTATFTVTTSYIGTVHYAIVPAGTPNKLVTQSNIYSQSLSFSVSYGSAKVNNNVQGVNIDSTFQVTGLEAQKNYKIAVYLDSTVGTSPIIFLNFQTNKASNPAAIKLAMSAVLADQAAFKLALSKVLRIKVNRIYILTSSQTLADQQNHHQSSVMKNRNYIYDTMVAPDRIDDSISPLSLLTAFKSDQNAKNMLLEFVPQYVMTYTEPLREVFNTVPRIRNKISITARKYDLVEFKVQFWEQAFVYAVILQNSTATLMSEQIINGLDENNTAVITQHYKNITADSKGRATITFNLLNDKSTYKIFVSAQSPMPFPPRLSLADSNVMTQTFRTPANPNLIKNEQSAVQTIRQENTAMADEVEKVMRKNEQQKKIHNVDKTKKKRSHQP